MIKFLNATAWVSIAMIIIGFGAGFTPYKDTVGGLFPIGLLLFLIVGFLVQIRRRP